MFSCAAISAPTPKPAKPDDGRKSKPLQVTGRLRQAIEHMVWRGWPRDQAATAAELTPHALYTALRKAHVKAFYMSELEVLRTSERARNVHRLVEIRDKAENMPAVQAIGMLERMADDNSLMRSGTSAATPGVTIHIHAAPQDDTHSQPVRVIDANPLITHDPDILHENVDAP